MNRKLFWSIAIGYAFLTFVLNNVMNTQVGEFMMQLSYIALAGIVIWWIYSLLKYKIKQQTESHKNMHE